MRHARFLAVSAVAFAVCAVAACVGYPYGPMHDWDMHGFGYGAFISWMLFVIVVAVIVYVAYRLFSGTHPKTPMETPLDILKRRYARGEISKEEFERMKRDLLE